MKKNFFKDLRIVLVSYRSKKKIDKTLSIIDKKISIILVENSMDISIKKEFSF